MISGFIKKNRLVFPLLFGHILSVLFLSGQANLQKTSRLLHKGVSLSHYEQYWVSADSLLDKKPYNKIRQIAANGFRCLRLPVSFDHFSLNNRLNEHFLNQLDSVVRLCQRIQLPLIIVYHHGKLSNENYKTEIRRIQQQWEQLVLRYKGRYQNSLFFELYNEPVISANQWKIGVQDLVESLRRQDASRIFIIGGTEYNSIDGLDQLGIINDRSTIYTFHFYEPFFFTHQGAYWQKQDSLLKGIPYPTNSAMIPPVFLQTNDSWLMTTRWKYLHENDKAFLGKRLAKVKAYQKRYPGVVVICTETGVIKQADTVSRQRYFTDILKILYPMPVLFWDYDDQFAISDEKGKTALFMKHILGSDSY